MTRLLAIDLGERRIGLAVADDLRGGAAPLTTVVRGRSIADDVATLGRVVQRERIDELIVGLPIDTAGTEGVQADRTRSWAAAVAADLDRPIAFRDERFSSRIAEERLGPMPRGRSGGPPTATQRNRYRARVDREAAAIILEAELRARAATAPATAPAPAPVGGTER